MDWLKLLKNLKPAVYNYTEKGQEKTGLNNKKSFGFIAQDLEKIFPQDEYNIVMEDKEGYKSINYYQLIPILYKIVQEQQKQIDDLTNIIKTNNLNLTVPDNISPLLES